MEWWEEDCTDGYVAFKNARKYWLVKNYRTLTPYRNFDITTEWIRLFPDGTRIIRAGYASDGPSGPTWDSMSAMRAAWGHDADYQLFREEELPLELRPVADAHFRDVAVVDGMWPWRADAWYKAVRLFAGGAASPDNIRPVVYAPRNASIKLLKWRMQA